MSVIASAAAVAGPKAAADATGYTGVLRYATATSSTSVALPTKLKTIPGAENASSLGTGMWLTVQSRSVDTDFAFSTAAQALVKDQTAALGTGNAAAGWTVLAGTSMSVLIPSNCAYINFVSSNTGGFFEFYMSEIPAPTK